MAKGPCARSLRAHGLPTGELLSCGHVVQPLTRVALLYPSPNAFESMGSVGIHFSWMSFEGAERELMFDKQRKRRLKRTGILFSE